MSDEPRDPFAEVINLLAVPIASGLRAAEGMKRGADELWRAIENVNRTMDNLNETTERLNRVLSEVEEPIRAMMPQLTRTIRNADEITQRLEGPVRAVAPNLEQIATTFGSPGFESLPQQVSEFMASFSEFAKRLGPLTQLAENAGGLFGGFRIPGMPTRPNPGTDPEANAKSTVGSTVESTVGPDVGSDVETIIVIEQEEVDVAKPPQRKAVAKKKAAVKKGTRASR